MLDFISFWIMPILGVILLIINILDGFSWYNGSLKDYIKTYGIVDLLIVPVMLMIPILNIIIFSIVGIGTFIYFLMDHKRN